MAAAKGNKFAHRPSAKISPEVLAGALSNVAPSWPLLHRYSIPYFMYSQIRFESRPCEAELEVFE
eukprot:6350600-Alexandrium_andersonii.AAC.1